MLSCTHNWDIKCGPNCLFNNFWPLLMHSDAHRVQIINVAFWHLNLPISKWTETTSIFHVHFMAPTQSFMSICIIFLLGIFLQCTVYCPKKYNSFNFWHPRTCCTGWDSNLNWFLYFNEMPVVHLYEQLLGLNVGLCYSVSDGQPHLRWQEINYLSTFKIFPFFTSLCLLQRPLPKKGCCCGVKGKLLLTEMWTFRTSILGNLPLFQEIEAISKMLCQIFPTVVQVYIGSENFALP